MKKLMLLPIALMLYSAANAQHFHMNPGLKGGLNIAMLNSSESEVDYSTRVSFQAGGLLHMHFAKHWAVQPELFYSGQGAKTKLFEEEINLNLSYINLPVVMQYMFGNGFRLQSGPQVGYLVSAHAKSDASNSDIKSSLNNVDFSWAFGASYVHRSGFGVDARYNLGLSNLNDENEDVTLKNSVFAFRIVLSVRREKEIIFSEGKEARMLIPLPTITA